MILNIQKGHPRQKEHIYAMQRIRQLDGIRAIAILSVFIHHAMQVKLLWMGVDLFFVLSGFLITGVLLDAKSHSLAGFFAHFYSRRARRILAPYLLFLALASIFFGMTWTQHWYLYILLTNFLTPLHIPHPGVFDPLWSLAVEEQFYLVWPFAIYFLSERRLRQLCIALIVLTPLLRGAMHFQEHWPIYMLTPFRMDLLASGGLLCLEWRSRRERIERYGSVMGLTLLGVGLAGVLTLMKFGYSTHGNTRMGNVLIYEACLLIALGAMIFALGGHGVGWLRSRPMTYIGQISYSMYLVHIGIILLVSEKFHGVLAASVALAMTVAYAAISWSAMESRLLGRKRSKVASEMQPA
jgi:peptidoglycan/LPS O-acetylase OafA/YrhL